jgi:RimJ/RimL family protein N-acetyltransferase
MKIAIETDDLLLRSWQVSDASQLASIGNDADIAWNMNDGFPNPFTLEKANEFIKNATQSSNILLAIVRSNSVVGSIGAFFCEGDATKATIAYYIGKDYWRLGYATKAIRALVEYLIKEKGVQSIHAEPFERNGASRRALEKNGFRNAGIIKNGSMKDHEAIDIVRYEYARNR